VISGPAREESAGAPAVDRLARLRSSALHRVLARLGVRRLVRWWRGRRVKAAIDVLAATPFDEIQRRGWHFQPKHRDWPLNDVEFLHQNRDLWHGRGLPKSIAWNIDEQLALAEELDAYRGELEDAQRVPGPRRDAFAWENGAFSGADPTVYYGMVRSLPPRRVIEVGAGWSGLLLARALERNERRCEVTLIDADPSRLDRFAFPGEWRIHNALLQRIEMGAFDALDAGDICFLDGSHSVRTASDVTWFFFEVIPRLSPGVRIHIHDIHLPDDYPDRLIFEEGYSWNEQYLVQAFLMNNDAYRVMIANHLVFLTCRDGSETEPRADGGSIWLEKVGPAER
jgi:hypothetical protein